MSFMDFFSTRDNTQQRQQGSSSSQGFNQSNVWPQFAGYLNNYAAYQAPAGFNQWQNLGVGQQAGAANYLQPGAWASGQIATGGLDPNDIGRFYNQNTQSVVDATKRSFEYDRGKQLGEASGQAARMGAWGGSGAGTLRAQTDEAIHRAQDPIVAKAYYDAQKQAVDTAVANQGQRIQAAGLAPGFTQAASGAGTNLAQQGNWMQQQPLNWMTQWNSALAPYLQAAGQRTSSTGQTDMVGSSRTQHQPSPFDIFAGGASMFAGMPFGFAEGGHVGGGGKKRGAHPHPDFADKVGHAFRSFHKLRKAAEGGIVDDSPEERHAFPDGGVAGDGPMFPWAVTPSAFASDDDIPVNHSWNTPGPNGLEDAPGPASWYRGTEVNPAPIGKDWGSSIADGLSKWSAGMRRAQPQQPGQPQGNRDPFASLKDATQRLRQLTTDALPPPMTGVRYAGGGEVEGYADGSDVGPPESSGGFSLWDYLPKYKPEGIWKGEQPTPGQRFSMALGAIGSDRAPFKGFSANLMQQNKDRMAQAHIDQAADIALGKIRGPHGGNTLAFQQAQGKVGGLPTVAQQQTNLEAARNPAQIKSLEAHSEEAQKRIAEFKTKQEKDLAALQFLQKAEQDIDNNVTWGVYDSDPARNHAAGEARRQLARDLYNKMRQSIQDVNTPPAPTAVPPKGARLRELPDGTIVAE